MCSAKSRTCSVKSTHLGLGKGRVRDPKYGTHDLCLHEPFHPVTEAMTRARQDTQALRAQTMKVKGIVEMAETPVVTCCVKALASSSSKSSSTRKKSTGKSSSSSKTSSTDAADGERSQSSEMNVEQATRLGEALVTLGCRKVRELAVIDDGVLLEAAAALEPPIPGLIEQRIAGALFALLHRAAKVAALGKQRAMMPTRMTATRRKAVQQRVNLGGHDALKHVPRWIRQDDFGCVNGAPSTNGALGRCLAEGRSARVALSHL